MKKIISLLLLLFGFFLNQAKASASMIDIDPGFGGSFSEAYKTSDDGSVVVGYNSGSSANTSFKYFNSSFVDLQTLPGAPSSLYATSVSGDGQIIVGSLNLTGGYHALKYSNGGGFVDLGVLGSGNTSRAQDISSDGSVIVGYSNLVNGGVVHAFKYTDFDGMIDLGVLSGGSESKATAVSADGSTVVGFGDIGSGIERAFKYTDSGGMVDLMTLGGDISRAWDVSGNGAFIVGESQISSGSYRAFKYSDLGGMVDIGFGDNSWAVGISNDGSIIVGAGTNSSGNNIALKYTDSGGVVDLGTLGGSDAWVSGISGDGKVIVGSSQTSDGSYHAFMYNNEVSDSSLVDINNTYAALYENGRSLNSILNLKTAITRSLLNQDCDKFGANGFCVGVGYRYASVNHQHMSQQASNLRIGYRFTPNFRAGLIFDQTVDSNDPNNFTTQNKTPMSGFFLNYSQREDGSGFGARVAAIYAKNTTDITRLELSNTEAGMGRAKMKTSGMLAEVSYGQKFSKNLMIKPFAALRKTEVSRGGYVETQGASFPISYNALEQSFTTAVFGLRSLFNLNKETALSFEVGTESKIRGKVDGYSGNISYLGDFALNSPNVRRQTNYFDVGIHRDLPNNQRISANFHYGSQNLNSAKVGMMYLGYYLGF